MGRTSIPCDDETRDKLAEQKPEDVNWDDFLLTLAGEADAVQTNSNELSFDDVKGACAAALRDEIPDRAFR